MENAGTDEEKAHKLLGLIASIEAGEISALQAAREFAIIDEHSTVASVVATNKAVSELENGDINIEEAEELIHSQSDLHPTASPIFLACSLLASKSDKQLEMTGYVALSKIKSDRYMTEEVSQHAYASKGAFSKLVDAFEKKPALLGKDFYLSSEADDHVVNHFLVQELADSETILDRNTLKLVLDRRTGIEPIVIGLLRDLLGPQLAIAPYNTLMHPIKILGCWNSLDALPYLLKALNICVTEQLQEAIIALVKLGSQHPKEVSEGLIGIINDPKCGDGRFAAIEALGFLWSKENNLEFLSDAIGSLDRRDAMFNGMFSFLAQSLLMTGQQDAAKKLSKMIKKDKGKLNKVLVEKMGKTLEQFKPQEDNRLERLADEDIYDICCSQPDSKSKNWRMTMTLRRERRLAEEAGVMKEMEITRIEELMKTGKDKPCPCGSGNEFQNCCLHKLEAQIKMINSNK